MERLAGYRIIKKFYGDKKAKRSQVPLINHIKEGVTILCTLECSTDVKEAYCIHPIVQNEEPGWEDLEVSDNVMSLAKKYREVANSYLCRPHTDFIQTPELLDRYLKDQCVRSLLDYDVACMLYADKFQNYKDFKKYHRGTHERSRELEQYFRVWLSYLRKIIS